jgi:hypothetical protein
MEALIVMLLLPLPLLVQAAADPAPGIWQSKREARNLECVRMSLQQANDLHPGQFPEAPARRTASLHEALVCGRRIMAHGERPARDEHILSSLSVQVGELGEAAVAAEGAHLTWHVDTFYPEPRVAQKVTVAARTHLAQTGRKVSDRVPLLAAGDLVVLSRLPPQDAYPLACARYFAAGALKEGEAFLGLMIVHPRETQLHAGTCVDGQWRWLR